MSIYNPTLVQSSSTGIWIVQDPYRKLLLNVKLTRVTACADHVDIFTDSSKKALERTLSGVDYGTRWFTSRKDAIRYLNSLTN